ncbi:MAG: TIGR04283 family arsenosugar biosynthesis glycosyltransferase [Desmonostoc vinosum HA7617-LM4]|jgi:rSAM/selenodomain-associated transferase 2|nr:TIGR04283 family arsenosugar biosynthesis glycosyltransferase [Desmonostoc vinosum HA7617-LM4]
MYSTNFTNAKISIIIPTLNEAKNIQEAISSLRDATQTTSFSAECYANVSNQANLNIEVIVVDGGSQDSTVAIAQSLDVKVISSSPGRAAQMNAGAMVASGEILLFLHADTRLPVGYDVMVCTTLQQAGTVAGAFELQIDAPLLSLRLVEWGVNLRSHFWQMPYGDQAIFLTKQVFQQVGNFPDLPIMEDFELMRHLKRLGRIVIIPTPVITSARRWLRKGVFKTTLINQIVIIAYLLGVSPAQIRSWYRQEKFRRF